MQHGHLLEQIIANFSSRFFMRDFVLLNPKYSRAVYEKELADILLVLDDTCIVVSVKGTDGESKGESKLKSWLSKKRLKEASRLRAELIGFQRRHLRRWTCGGRLRKLPRTVSVRCAGSSFWNVPRG